MLSHRFEAYNLIGTPRLVQYLWPSAGMSKSVGILPFITVTTTRDMAKASMQRWYNLSLLAFAMILSIIMTTALPSRKPQNLCNTFSVVAQRTVIFGNEDAGIKSVTRRTGVLTGTAGDWDLTLALSDQLMPIQVAASVIESFYQSVMGKSITYSLTDRRPTPAFRFKKGALVLLFRCVSGGPSGCFSWPLVTMFSQYMMQRAQTGFTGQYIGHIQGPDGVMASVTFMVAGAVAQELMDSASDIHGH